MKQKSKNSITRRDFVKKAGRGLAAFGTASIIPHFVRPARAATRDYILIGRPETTTGPRAGFGEPSPWADNRILEYVNKKEGGIYIKEVGKKVPVRIKLIDNESIATKAGETVSRLILHDKVDMIIGYQFAETIASICESHQTPNLIVANPFELWISGGPYKWSFHSGISFKVALEALIAVWEANAHRTNMTFGLMAPNDADGINVAKVFGGIIQEKRWTLVDPGRFPSGLRDWTSVIKRLQEGNTEILMGSIASPDFAALWRQMHQQGFLPKICSVGRANLFPAGVNAIGGDLAHGIVVDIHWSPQYPFRSALTGETCQEVADAWDKETGKQWTQPIGFKYAGMELAIDILKRAQSVDKHQIIKAMAETNVETFIGRVKYNEQHHYLMPVVAGQWVKAKKWPYEVVIINSRQFPSIPVTAEMIFPLPGYRKQ